jgi:prophage antirepressor-like protein
MEKDTAGCCAFHRKSIVTGEKNMNKSNRIFYRENKIRVIKRNGYPWIFANDISDLFGEKKENFFEPYPTKEEKEIGEYNGTQKLKASIRESTRDRNMVCVSLPVIYDLVKNYDHSIAKDLGIWLKERLIPFLRKYDYKVVEKIRYEEAYPHTDNRYITNSQFSQIVHIIIPLGKDASIYPGNIMKIIQQIRTLVKHEIPIDQL